ncbi:Hypothetical predicted protein [Cloeon dipterum]|uniref:Oligopeptide transporter 1 n=1 Tax=Cloeon dipterum TaxID=197152 RepID=A0A8S1DU74_9INSE|nr:Hypothetical predicted protein [Cloeon dipterum]
MSDDEKKADAASIKSIESKKEEKQDVEAYTGPPLKYPKSVFFIITNEFCERFCYYGMRTILSLYFVAWLNYTEDQATTAYHGFLVLCYFTPVLGAIVADSWLGRFKTILILSIVYAFGSVFISLSAIPSFLPPEAFTWLGLVLIGLGTGGIKPCVSAFGGDQFVVPEQEKQLQKYFSIFYLSVNGGSLLSTFLTPILREDVNCFGRDDCYSLAFGVPAILMVVSLVIFVVGKPMYKCKKPGGNIVVDVCACIGHGIKMRIRNRKGEKKEHWLDHAEEKYGKKMVHDVKLALKVLAKFLTVPIFWALYDQQGSRWTFQATRMDGDLGGFTVKPDQMQVVNPLMIVVMIPLFETVFYPLCKKLNILQKPLTKMYVGGTMAGVAFIMSAIVELFIKPSTAIIPSAGEAQLRIFNTVNNCPVIISALDNDGNQLIPDSTIEYLGMWENLYLSAKGKFDFTLNVGNDCDGINNRTFRISLEEEVSQSYVLHNGIGASTQIKITERLFDSPEKSDNTKGKVRVIVDPQDAGNNIVGFKLGSKTTEFTVNQTIIASGVADLDPAEYTVSLNGVDLPNKYSIRNGGVYTFLLDEDGSSISQKEITPPNNVHMMWLIPQYFVMTFGEILFSVTGLEFAFTQAPLTMKSVMLAGWYVAVAVGNLVVIFVAEAKIFEDQMWEFVLFAGLMFVGMVILFIQAWGYEYVSIATEEEQPNGDNQHRDSIKSANKED